MMTPDEVKARFSTIYARVMAQPLPPIRPPVKTRWHYREKKRRLPDPAALRSAALGRATESPRLSPSQRAILDMCRPIDRGLLVQPGVVGPEKRQ